MECLVLKYLKKILQVIDILKLNYKLEVANWGEMKGIPKIILVALFMSIYGSVQSQIGTEFWFVAPEITKSNDDKPIFLRMSTYDNPANVTISQPANPNFNTITLAINANETQAENLAAQIGDIENSPADNVNPYGLLITSDEDISVYYDIKPSGKNMDIFTLKGENALGTEFFIPAQDFWFNDTASYSTDPYSAFDIVATENGTSVSITPEEDIVGHQAGVTFTVNLDRGETYSARALYAAAGKHLGGSKVTSNKPIAITISDDSGKNTSYGSCDDLMGDQLIPTNITGNEYLVLKGQLSSGLDDKVYVTATTNNTDLYINGSATPAANLQAGEQYVVSLSSTSVLIESSENVYVYHVTGIGCEVAAAIVPPMVCTGSRSISFTRSKSEEFYLMVMVPNGSEDEFEINGDPTMLVAGDFTTLPSTGGTWMGAVKYFTKSEIDINSNFIITNNDTRFKAAILQGDPAKGCMYAHYSEFSIDLNYEIFHYQ